MPEIKTPSELTTDAGSFNIRQLASKDLPQIYALECRAHPTPWRKSDFESSLTSHHCFGLFMGEVLCGHAIFSLVLDEAELLLFVLDNDWRAKGIGHAFLSLLVEAVSAKAQRIFLEVRASNTSAIRLYEACEFNEIGVRENYYPGLKGRREDALIYARELML